MRFNTTKTALAALIVEQSAEQGLLISWGGFKQSVERERATQFFRVRLWNRNDLIENLLAHYDALDEDLRSELPLKRIWTITNPGDE